MGKVIKHIYTHALSLSLTHTHTPTPTHPHPHTHTLSLSLSHTHTLSLSLARSSHSFGKARGRDIGWLCACRALKGVRSSLKRVQKPKRVPHLMHCVQAVGECLGIGVVCRHCKPPVVGVGIRVKGTNTVRQGEVVRHLLPHPLKQGPHTTQHTQHTQDTQGTQGTFADL